MLDDFHERLSPEMSSREIATRLQRRLQSEIRDGVVNVLGAPPLDGLGTTGGFKVMLEDRGAVGLNALQTVADQVVCRQCRFA